MRAPKYIDRSITTIFDNRNRYNTHIKNLEQIIKKDPKSALRANYNNSRSIDRAIQSQFASKILKEEKKQKEIQKNNERLLSRLMDISQGRDKQVRFLLKEKSKIEKSQYRETRSATKKLSNSFIHRKTEAEKISKENERMLVRLMTSKSTLSRQYLDRDYEKKKEFGNRLRKFTPDYSKKLAQAQKVPAFLKEKSFHSSRMNTSREELVDLLDKPKRNINHIPKIPNSKNQKSRNRPVIKFNPQSAKLRNERAVSSNKRGITSNINSNKFNHAI